MLDPDREPDPLAAMRAFATYLTTRTTAETLTAAELRHVGGMLLEIVDAAERQQAEVQAMREREQDLRERVETLRALHAGALAAVAQWAPRDYN